jgi:hypothetical protein
MEDSMTRPTPAQEAVSAASPPADSLWRGADGRTIRCRAVENGTLFFDVHMPDAGGWIENLSVTLELFHDWVARRNVVQIEGEKPQEAT